MDTPMDSDAQKWRIDVQRGYTPDATTMSIAAITICFTCNDPEPPKQ